MSSKYFPSMASKTDRRMNLRLMINKKSGKILYAEAGKDFVDLLFGFLTLPTASVIKLLSALNRAKNIGCLKNLYNSVEKLQSVLLNTEKSHLLNPTVMFSHPNSIFRIESAPTLYYVCSADRKRYWGLHDMSAQIGAICACGERMCWEVELEDPSVGNNTNSAGTSGGGSSGVGYVKETVTFTITDDLQISPSSAITSLNLLNKLNVKGLSDLMERNASVGPNEALGLLWASIVSTTPLNDVFGGAVLASVICRYGRVRDVPSSMDK